MVLEGELGLGIQASTHRSLGPRLRAVDGVTAELGLPSPPVQSSCDRPPCSRCLRLTQVMLGAVMALLPTVGSGAPLVPATLDRSGQVPAAPASRTGLFAPGFGVVAMADELIGAALGSLLLGTGATRLVTANSTESEAATVPSRSLTSTVLNHPIGRDPTETCSPDVDRNCRTEPAVSLAGDSDMRTMGTEP
jgi:hypothetical protein